MTETLLGIIVFVGMTLTLTILVISARAFLVPSGNVVVKVNEDQEIIGRLGDKLLSTLAENGISIPSACGGAGTCGQCKIQITEGSSDALPTEAALLSRRDIADGLRLACQTTMRNQMSISLPESMLFAKSWDCSVISSRTVAPIIREIVLDLPEKADFSFTPGAFVQVEAPAYSLRFADYAVSEKHQVIWDRLGLSDLMMANKEKVSRAYSIANNAKETNGILVLLIRLALPPPDNPSVPPGIVSSWLFGREVGDKVTITGPFGTFAAKESHREMIFIGGGVGMAPLRAIVSDQLEGQGTQRRMSFWYGARSRVDLFYEEEFDRLQAAHSNFSWTPALSDPASNDNWKGEIGFIHEVVFRRYLAKHPAPHECEYYLCGPPLMIRAVLAMLEDLGVDPNHIFNDDFGG
jgi:Na+-transporting NADH:ubiquinone oxidoreductase subunit F